MVRFFMFLDRWTIFASWTAFNGREQKDLPSRIHVITCHFILINWSSLFECHRWVYIFCLNYTYRRRVVPDRYQSKSPSRCCLPLSCHDHYHAGDLIQVLSRNPVARLIEFYHSNATVMIIALPDSTMDQYRWLSVVWTIPVWVPHAWSLECFIMVAILALLICISIFLSK